MQGEDSMSEVYQSLSHSKWDCKYHVVFVLKRRRKAIFGPIRKQLGPAGLEQMFFEFGVPLPEGSTEALPPTTAEIDRLLAEPVEAATAS
jgi:putative transposase